MKIGHQQGPKARAHLHLCNSRGQRFEHFFRSDMSKTNLHIFQCTGIEKNLSWEGQASSMAASRTILYILHFTGLESPQMRARPSPSNCWSPEHIFGNDILKIHWTYSTREELLCQGQCMSLSEGRNPEHAVISGYYSNPVMYRSPGEVPTWRPGPGPSAMRSSEQISYSLS